jgi:hypothetical protein
MPPLVWAERRAGETGAALPAVEINTEGGRGGGEAGLQGGGAHSPPTRDGLRGSLLDLCAQGGGGKPRW